MHSKKSKYSIRTVKLLQITSIKLSNIQVTRMITVRLSVQKLSICKSQGNMLLNDVEYTYRPPTFQRDRNCTNKPARNHAPRHSYTLLHID